MKILHISDIDINAKGGGMNTVIPFLIDLQNKVESNTVASLLLTNSTPEKSCQYKFKIYDTTFDYRSLIKISDVVVFHSVYNLKFIPFYFFLKKNKIPYIIVSHGAFSKPTQDKGKFRKLLFRKVFLNKFVRDALAISFLTRDEQINSIYPNKDYIIVPNIIDKKNLISIEPAETVHSFDKKLRIVFMSKIDYHHKGLDVLFEAIFGLKEKLLKENVEFLIYGYGKSKNLDLNNVSKKEKDILRLISDITNLGLSSIVKFMGPVFGDEKKKAIRSTDIMILPSRLEGMPLTIIEFLGCNIPCIITSETNMGEHIREGKCGWVANFDVESLSNTILLAIHEYKKNPDLYRVNSLETFRRLNSIDIGSVSINAYRKLLTEKYNLDNVKKGIDNF